MRLAQISRLSKVVVAAVFLAGCGQTSAPSIPKITSRIMDTTTTLNAWQKSSLISNLSRIDRELKAEIVIYILNKLPEGENLEEYSNKVFNTWKIGKKGTDSGVLIVNVIDDKKIRLEIGRGNEGSIPDMIANRIIKDHMVHYLSRGMYYEAYTAGITQIERHLKERK